MNRSNEKRNITKHTPGPWDISSFQSHVIVGSPEIVGNAIATCHISRAVGDLSTADANARLIAAAPDLLEACRALVLEWNSCFEGQDTGYDGTPLHDCVMLASAAIAKAEGKNQEG